MLPAVAPQVKTEQVKEAKVLLVDRVSLAPGAHGFDCWIDAYNKEVGKRRFQAIIAAPSSTSARRVLREELGPEWTYMDWNAGQA